MKDWLHSSANKPYIRRLFSELKFGDSVQELTYTMKYSIDNEFDEEFITDLLGIGLVIEWITPKINSLNNIQQMYGSSEEKFFSQTNHLNGLKDLKKSLLKVDEIDKCEIITVPDDISVNNNITNIPLYMSFLI